MTKFTARSIAVRRIVALSVAATMCWTVAGCGGDGSPAAKRDGVASIATPSASAKAPGSAETTGTVLRIDMTEADIKAVNDAYDACLRSHGVKGEVYDFGGTKVEKLRAHIQDYPEAVAACKDKEPQIDPLLDKQKNPHYADQTRAWMKCMTEHGIPVTGNWDDEFFNIDRSKSNLTSEQYLEIYRRCQMESYKG